MDAEFKAQSLNQRLPLVNREHGQWGLQQMLTDQFKQIAELLALAIEAGAVLVVTYGALEAVVRRSWMRWAHVVESPRRS